MPRKLLVRTTVTVLIVAVAIWAWNTSWFARPIARPGLLVAHRGLAQDFSREGLTGKTCTAARMIPSGHDYLENTIASMRAAFEAGADVVEFDVHPTTDGQIVVFHDWTLDCRTDGSGVTREHTLDELQALDVGHGYTADGGRSFPFRGRGVGLMPSLDEVLTTFPDRDFVIDVKGNEEGALLADHLERLLPGRESEITLTGGAAAVSEVRLRLPALRTITRPQLKRCLGRYLAWGWSGHVPRACGNRLLTIPANVAPWLWGWPHRFLRRMDAAGSRVVLLGDYGGEGFSSGLDDPARIAALPHGVGVWTDRIEQIAPVWIEHRRD